MDQPDNTENNLNISLDSEYFLDKQVNPAENDIIAELFQTHLKDSGVINGHVEDAHNSDVDLPVCASPELERGKTPECVTEVENLIERVKQDRIDFKEKYYETQKILVDYENKLAEFMNNSMKLQVEVSALTESNQVLDNENKTLKLKLEEKEAELKQFKSLIQKQIISEEDSHVAKKEIAEITKALKKSEKMYAASMELHNKRIKQMVKYKRNYKRVMSQLLECSEIIASNNLLPLKHIKNLEHFMETCKDINLDSEDISEDSSLSLDEENSMHNCSLESNTLANGTYIKPNANIISPYEELTKSCLSSHLSTNGYLSSANMKSSTNLKLSPLHQDLPSDTKGIHCEVSKNDNSHVFQLPFSPSKSKAENLSNLGIKKNKIVPNNVTETTVNSRFSDDMEVTDDVINLKEIMGSMVMKVEDLNLISPIPESPLKKSYSYSDKIVSRKNDLHPQTPYKNSNLIPKEISSVQSNDYKKNRFSHQTSSGFEPHIEEKFEIDSSTSNTALISRNPFLTPISPNLHYLSSAYTNNTFQILHQGSSALDYIANSDTKFTAFVLTIPKKSSRNNIYNNEDEYVLPCIEDRLSSVQSLYNAAIKPEISIKTGILDSRENKTEKSVNDPFPYICVQIDSKNGQINLTSNLQNNSMSDKHSSPCPTIEERKSGQINLSDNQTNNYVSDKHKNPCLSIKKQLSEVVHEENLVPEYMEQERDDNQSFVSDPSVISPHKRKLAKTLHYHGINEKELNISKKENNLPVNDKVIGHYNESSETNHSSESEGNRSLLPNETNKPRNSLHENHHVLSVESEKSLHKNLKKHFSAYGDEKELKSSFVEAADKVLESSEKEDHFVLNSCNSNIRTVTNETAIAMFDNGKTTISSPESNIFVGKNMSVDIQPTAAHDSDLQNSLSPLKDEVNFILNTCKLNSEPVQSEMTTSDKITTKDKVTTSTPKCISIGKDKSADEMNFAVTYDNNLQSNLPLVKQKLFLDNDSKSHTLQSFKSKSCDAFDNSDKSKEESGKTIIKHPCLSSKSVVNSNSDKEISNTVVENQKMLHNFSDSSSENVLSTDVELPASKKRKLLKSSFNLFSKNESVPTLNDKPPEYGKTVTENSPKTTENLQSSIHLVDNTTVNKSYGVFKTVDNNLSSSYDEERNITLHKINSVDSPENIKKNARQAPNVTANKDSNDSLNKNNLSNSSKKRKTKNKNKRKKKNLSSSNLGIFPENSKKSLSEVSQHFTSFMAGLQNNLKSQSSDKKLSQTETSCSIFGQKEIKSDLNSPALKKNNTVEFNTEINSGAKFSNKNICNVPQLENTIIKRKEKFIHSRSLNVQEVDTSSKNSEEMETSVLNIDQEKFTDNLSIKEVSNNQLKMIEKNDKLDSSPADFEINTQINSGTEVNYESNCNIPSLENTIMKTFNVQEVIHSSKSTEETSETFSLNTDKKEFSDKDNLSTIKVSNKKLKRIEETGEINSSSELPSEDLLNRKAQCNSSFSHETTSESIKTESKQELHLKGDVINVTAANGISSEEHSKVSSSNTFETIENFDDSIISDDENPLVIADVGECNSAPESASNIENNEALAAAPENSTGENDEVASSSEIEKPAKNKKKRRKRSKAHNANKRKKSQSSCEEESISNSCTIEHALDDIKKMKFEEMLTNHSKYKLLLHKLISALINPANAPNTTSALYQIFRFLSSSKLNPLVSYPVKKNTSVFFPPAENCIVEALIKTESKKKLHLQGLIPSAISTLYYLILDKKSISKTGLGALCRIFTQLCKVTQNKQKPIKLTCDLIKEQHPLAPVLVAFIKGTWVELFEPPEDRDVFRTLHLSCIYFGLQKKPSTVTSADWNACKAVFNLTPVHPLPTDSEETVNMLISSVENLITEPPTDTDDWACDQILIIAVTKGWTWTQEKLVERLIGFLHRYAKDVNNERAFSLYAELCADIGKQEPDECYTILEALSDLILVDSEFEYVRKHAAQSLLKLLLFKHLPIPEMLTEYIQENENNLSKNVELYLRRRCIADVSDLTESDILIT